MDSKQRDFNSVDDVIAGMRRRFLPDRCRDLTATVHWRLTGEEPREFTVAIDGLSVVVAKSNTFAQCLTVDQLHDIWTAVTAQQLNTWKQVNPAWPDQKINLFGPGTDSGTFDYFKEAIIHPQDGSSASTRSRFTPMSPWPTRDAERTSTRSPPLLRRSSRSSTKRKIRLVDSARR